MRSTQEIVEFIDFYIDNCLERPHMYAASPLAMEDMLYALDLIRQFITNESLIVGEPFPSAYARYLEDKGFGVATFIIRKIQLSHYDGTDESLFAELADFWREYISQRDKYR